MADGKRFGAAVGKDPVPGPMARRPGVPPRPATVWFKDFSQVILAGVGQPVHPFASLIADGRRQGYRVSTETRTIPYKGRKLVHHRLLLKKGPAQFEIVIDPMGDVPVSVTNMIGNDSSRWSAVNWDLKPGKDLNPYEARFMKPGQARDIAPRPRRS